MGIKKIQLKKNIDGQTYDVYTKTSADIVMFDNGNTLVDELDGVIRTSKPILQSGNKKYLIGVTKDGRFTCKAVEYGEPEKIFLQAPNGTLREVTVTNDGELVTNIATDGAHKNVYIKAELPYEYIYKMSVLDDGNLVSCPIGEIDLILDDNVSKTKTWSSYKILSELDKKSSGGGSAEETTFDNSDNGMTATNVQEAIEENKTSILSLEKLVAQANQTLIEECNKLLDI